MHACMYVCMYVCNLAMSSDVLLLLLFSRIELLSSLRIVDVHFVFYLSFIIKRVCDNYFSLCFSAWPVQPLQKQDPSRGMDGNSRYYVIRFDLFFPHRLLTVVRSYPCSVFYLMIEGRCVVGTERSIVDLN